MFMLLFTWQFSILKLTQKYETHFDFNLKIHKINTDIHKYILTTRNLGSEEKEIFVFSNDIEIIKYVINLQTKRT